jgi:multidrug efflux system outer membrane protein
MDLRGQQLQLQVAEKNAANQRETLDLTEKLLQGGRGTELDTSRALAQLKQTESDIPPIRTAIARDIHAISVLIGAQPQVLEDSLSKSRPIPEMPERIRVGSPADLLRRRPDIRAAERALEATSLRLNVATAELFPKVAFNSTIDVQARNFGKLGGPGILATTFGPEVSWPALNIWQVKAAVDAASAQVRGQLATYQKTVLTALQESEDALTDYGQQVARTSLLREAAAASEKAAKLANDRFQQGAADFLTVLQAELTMLQAQSSLAQSETSEAISVVTIYRALGGGWEGIGVDTKPVVQ